MMTDAYMKMAEPRVRSKSDMEKRTKVIDAIGILEKNKIPASNDNIMLQLGDGGICRKEVLEIISELYQSGYINKSKGNFRVSKSGKSKGLGNEAQTSSSPSLPSAGVSISHDGLPKISSVHSYHSGKEMSYPVGMVGKDENVHHHPSYLHPRFFHPHPHMMYHPAAAPPFMHPNQMIPIHVPYEHAADESGRAASGVGYPLAYYPFISSHDGKHMQWMFYPMSIPVNAVRPMVSDKTPKKENETPNKDSRKDLIPNEPSSSTKIKSPGSSTFNALDNEQIVVVSPNSADDIHPRYVLNPSEKKPFMQLPPEKLKYQNIAEDFNKASSILRDQGPSRVGPSVTTSITSNSSSCCVTKSKLTEEISNRFAMQPKEAILAKKRQQLLGIVDRVTEVAASKQNPEKRKKLGLNEIITNIQTAHATSNMTPVKYGSDQIETYIDEIAMEAAKLRDQQKREKEKRCNQSNCPPRSSLMSKIKDRLDDILSRSEEEKDQKLKEYSSSTAVRNILNSPPEFISSHIHSHRDEHNKAAIIRDSANFIDRPNFNLTVDPKGTYENNQHKLSDSDCKGHNEQNDDDFRYLDDSDDEPLFNPIDLNKLKNVDNFNPNIIVRDVCKVDKYKDILLSAAEDDNSKELDTTLDTSMDTEMDSSFGSTIDVDPSPFTATDEENEHSFIERQKENKQHPSDLKQYLTRKKLRLKIEEFRMRRNWNRDKVILGDTSERTKRSRTEVYYKESRTNFVRSHK